MPKVLTKSNRKLVAASTKPLLPVSAPAKSPLKWAGGKRKLVADILKLIPKKQRNRLIEPFVGGGSVFLNMDFDAYYLVDSNADLISMFRFIQQDCEGFIALSKALFEDKNNVAEQYYRLREQFNDCYDEKQRAAYFLYLNRHGYNGLCRYNSKGIYNVPFGQYKRPYFPEAEIRFFAKRATNAQFHQSDFVSGFENANVGDIVYCDPPYSPLNQTANFTAYSGIGFSQFDQQRLVEQALLAKEQGVTTIISNHYLPATKELYKDANKLVRLNVSRSISCKGQIRKPIRELLALYKP